MASENIRDLLKRSDMILIGVCVLLAAGFLLLAGKNAAEAGNFLTIDSLFFTAVCMLLALTFVAIPALTLRERGIHPFRVGDEIPPARAAEHVHFEGGTRLFLYVLMGLLGLTVIEVFLAYIHVPLHVMLTLIPTLAVCICLLFIVFPDSFRTREIRATRTEAVPATEGAPTHGHE